MKLRDRTWSLLKSLLFRFDAETAHHLVMKAIPISNRLGGLPLRMLSPAFEEPKAGHGPRVFGVEFISRVGLAAGFDKNAEILTALPQFGFGFAEIGTVTPRPQPGNPLPRLFRDPLNESLFNRMGFNSLGASIVSRNLAQAKERLPERFRVGVNLGKNRDTVLEEAGEDYLKAVRAFRDLADYLVINVSSPNTPGLRSLQKEEYLLPIVRKVVDLITGWPKRPPLLLKLGPELGYSELKSLLPSLESEGVDGWILTNTLAGKHRVRGQEFEGGWSGGVLTEISRRSLATARCFTNKPIISVGGITSVKEARARMLQGAELIQIYSGWIYQGPGFPGELSEVLRAMGFEGGKKAKAPDLDPRLLQSK